MSSALSPQERKALGSFYTDLRVVRFLVGWGDAVRPQAVMDPSCGDGRFLEAAACTSAVRRLVGCDISDAALEESRARLRGVQPFSIELRSGDFFALPPEEVEPVDLVVGNPPFIRFQRFEGESRRRALESALRLGVRLSRLTSSWAPFVLHSMRFLRPGGRLALVVPAEITQTHYGLRTLRAVLDHFGSATLIAFERNFFSDALEETCLLLAADRGGRCDHVRLLPLGSVEELPEAGDLAPLVGEEVTVPLGQGHTMRFAEAFMSHAERTNWERLRRHPGIRNLASVAQVTNGYVTGDNEFFHRRRVEAEERGIPSTWLVPAVRNSRSLRGLYFTRDDVVALEERGVAHHLLAPREDLFLQSHRPVLDGLISEGEDRGTPQRFKCRSREPWWEVPGAQTAEVLVGYMSGSSPKAVVNRAGAVYTNSLHGLRLRQDIEPELVALAFYSSATLLSLEIEGRSYGGGILKVEPRELDRVLLPLPSRGRLGPLASELEEVDTLLREGAFEEATRVADGVLLRRGLGLSAKAVDRLRQSRQRLVERRLKRSSS